MTFKEKLELCVSLAGGHHDLRFSNQPGRSNVVRGSGDSIKEATKAWHVEWGYMTSDTGRWIESGIMGEGDTIEDALDDCLLRQAKRLKERAISLRGMAYQNEIDAKACDEQAKAVWP